MKRATVATIATIIFVVLLALVVKKFLTRTASDTNEADAGSTGNYDYTGSEKPSTANFSCDEFDCKDGTAVPVEFYGNVQMLMGELQKLRNYLGLPIFINSGYRTAAYNATLTGSAVNSQHLVAKAADIRIPGKSPAQVHAIIEQLISDGTLHNGGLGSYPTFNHFDIRPLPARWNGA